LPKHCYPERSEGSAVPRVETYAFHRKPGIAGTSSRAAISRADQPAPPGPPLRPPPENLYNRPVANRAYASFWTRDYSEDLMLDRFERWLETVPLSTERRGFTSLVIRAIAPSEAPLLEHDFRAGEADVAAVIALAREHRNSDCSYELEAHWDLWNLDPNTALWQHGPQRLLLICQGPDYDDGVAAESSHFLADLGLEHFFTGHAGLLGAGEPRATPAGPVEATFLERMSRQEHLREYHEKTRLNIRQLLDWTRSVEHALPIERTVLRSEGEENLEARLDQILTVR